MHESIIQKAAAGSYDRALIVAGKALEIADKIVGPDHPDVATSLENLADLCRAANRDEEALELEKRAERIRAVKR